MILWREGKKVDYAKVREQVGKAYGIENPQNIQGFYGYFCYGEDNIWISEAVEKYLLGDGEFAKELDEAIKRFYKDDFGDIGKDVYSENIANKYLFGCYGVEGIYNLSKCRIKIDNNGWDQVEITII